MSEIDKLLEERGKIHGDAKTTHEMAWKLFYEACSIDDNNICKSIMSKAGEAMLFLIMVKIARGVQNPSYADHWDDIAGYAMLIKKVEAKK